MSYNLSSSQVARISFDDTVRRYALDCIRMMDADWLASTPANEIAAAYWQDGEGWETNDAEEALARYTAVFVSAVEAAKKEI